MGEAGPAPALDQEHRTFPCPQCGADLTFKAGAAALNCEFCGHTVNLEAPTEDIEERDYGQAVQAIATRRAAGVTQVGTHDQEATCSNCAATVRFTQNVTSLECAYCGTPIQRDEVHRAEDRLPVDGVLPFGIDREQAKAALKKWVRTRWFAPGEFKRRGAQGKFNGIYLPFFTHDAMANAAYAGERGDYYTVTVGSGDNKRTERRVRWSPASGSFQRFFDDVMVPATDKYERENLGRLEPWPLQNLAPFSAAYIAGYFSMTYEIPLEESMKRARAIMQSHLESEARRRIGGDTQRLHWCKARLEGLTYKHLLLPVWLLAYRFGEKTFRVAVNATTGEVVGERPYSWVKITLAVVAGLCAVGLAALLGR